MVEILATDLPTSDATFGILFQFKMLIAIISAGKLAYRPSNAVIHFA